MRAKLHRLFLDNLLLKGSFVILIGSTLANFGAYLYHLLMGRLLGPVDYSVLESLISVLYYLGIPMTVFGVVVVKYISGEKDSEKIARFFTKILNKVALWGFYGLIIFLLLFPLFRNLLKIDSFLLFLGLGITAYLGVFNSLFSYSLQGVMKFKDLSIYSVFSSWLKLFFSLVFLYFGFKVYGALIGLLLSSFLACLFGLNLAKKYINLFKSNNISIKDSFGNIRSYSLAVFFTNFSLISLFTADIILARYFLPSVEAGYYASLSILGKVIFYASSPIVSVMFPLVSSKHSAGENYQKLFWMSFSLILLTSLIISIIYFSFPELMINFLFGKAYLEGASSLGLFAVFLTLYSLCSLFLNFYLSISRTKAIFLAGFFAVVQVILIFFNHGSIGEIVRINIFTLSLLLLGLLLFYIKSFKFKQCS
ncbi:hypothetical protein C4578_02660 [Candidatus Microgenomates bacterium]|jgi:O-antigen/teichoic acid export membrane protein|nr:MAG: hypothetical protein C4578_02660 [Candidatus Microgenomates bacterium]